LKKLDNPALVGIVPRKKLWPIIQNQRWYHIPVKSAPRNALDVEFIAFYFPSRFGEEMRYQIIYYADVVGIDTVKRIHLFPDESEHPRREENYYQFHISKIMNLPRPIPSVRKRKIVHIPTTLHKLFTAQEINDLYHTSPLEEKMYKALKRRKISAERQLYVHLNEQVYYLDFCIFCQKANIDLECDGERYHILPQAFTKDRIRNNQLNSFGWHVLRFSSTEINRNIKNCLATVGRTIHTLSGLKA